MKRTRPFLMAHKLTNLGSHIHPSCIPGANLCDLAARNFRKGDIIGSHYVTLFHEQIEMRSIKSVNDGGMIVVHSKAFLNCSFDVKKRPIVFNLSRSIQHHSMRLRRRKTRDKLTRSQVGFQIVK